MHIIKQGLKQFLQDSIYSHASNQNHYLAHTKNKTLHPQFFLLPTHNNNKGLQFSNCQGYFIVPN